MRGKQVKETGRRETGEREDECKKQREVTRLTGRKKRKRGKQREGKQEGKGCWKRLRREEKSGPKRGRRRTGEPPGVSSLTAGLSGSLAGP